MDWYKENYSGGAAIEPVKIHDTFTPWLEQYAQKPKKMDAIVRKHASQIHFNAAAAAPVDTGALKNSFEIEQLRWSHYEIHDGVEYGVFQELGTSRGVTAKHFLGRAAEQQESKFLNEIAKELKE
jgi:HK97 gp10 family phage protein